MNMRNKMLVISCLFTTILYAMDNFPKNFNIYLELHF
jgi:hypothetical protein